MLILCGQNNIVQCEDEHCIKHVARRMGGADQRVDVERRYQRVVGIFLVAASPTEMNGCRNWVPPQLQEFEFPLR